MKIGVLGSGIVAKMFRAGLLAQRHDALVGTRESSKLAEWPARNPSGRVGRFDKAAAFGEGVVLAVKRSVAAEALRAAGSHAAGKTVIALCMPWCVSGFLRNEWTHAFKLLHR